MLPSDKDKERSAANIGVLSLFLYVCGPITKAQLKGQRNDDFAGALSNCENVHFVMRNVLLHQKEKDDF